MRGLNFKEQMTVEHLGEIEVRTLTYTKRREILSGNRSEDEESEGFQTDFMLSLLAECVTYVEDGTPCGTAEDWDLFAGRFTNEAMEVFNKACTLNGFEPEVIEKN